MPIYAKKKESDYSVPPEGLWPAVCCDVVDLGIVETQWGSQLKIKIVWQLEEVDEKTQRRFRVSQRYTPSLHEKSKLRPMLEAWRGKKFTEEESKLFDIEKLLGSNCQVQVVHNLAENGNVYANVQAVVKYPKNAPRIVVQDYVREAEREHQATNGNGSGTQKEEEDSYVPF